MSGKNTPTLSLLAPSPRTAAAGAVTTGSADLGKFPPHPLFHPKALNLPKAGLLLSSLSASRRETAAQAMADSFPRRRPTLSRLKHRVLSFPGAVYLPGFCHTHIFPPCAHLREHAVSTLDQLIANFRSCFKSVPVLLPSTLLFLGPQFPQWRGWPKLIVRFFAHWVSQEIRKHPAWCLVPALAWLLQKPWFTLWASDLPLLSLQNIFILYLIPSGSYSNHSSYLVPMLSPSYGAYQWVIQIRSKSEYTN